MPEQIRVQYTEEEQRLVVDYLMALKSDQIRKFLESHELKKSGVKSDLRERILEAIENGELTYSNLVYWIDQIEPWGKQHVFLYQGPEGSLINNWRNSAWVERHLQQHNVDRYYNIHLPLILPRELSISSIFRQDGILRIIAVERREYWERDAGRDEQQETSDGKTVQLRAYVHHIKRGLVIFEWDLLANSAMLQISQLPSGTRYENIVESFSELTAPWFDINRFSSLDIRRSIARLHEKEEAATPEARSHAIDYSSIGGRRLSGRSASQLDSLLGEEVVDEAMRNIRQQGVGHLGNFYWLPRNSSPANHNPLEKEIHVFIVGSKGRISFAAPNTEEAVRYVLSRVRALSQ